MYTVSVAIPIVRVSSAALQTTDGMNGGCCGRVVRAGRVQGPQAVRAGEAPDQVPEFAAARAHPRDGGGVPRLSAQLRGGAAHGQPVEAPRAPRAGGGAGEPRQGGPSACAYPPPAEPVVRVDQLYGLSCGC
eukprot:1178227-Prorocentrum_minimum.AAC.2